MRPQATMGNIGWVYLFLVQDMGFELTGGWCSRCPAPIVARGEWMGCWMCLTDDAYALNSKHMLEMFRMKMAGIENTRMNSEQSAL